jgi:hypothetical protein
MKSIILFVSVFLVTAVFAGDRKSLPRAYTVVSDVYSSEIPAGKCAVTGNVYITNYMDGMLTGLQGAQISTLDKKKSATTDENGNYKMLLDSKDTTIYMFSQYYEEVVIWNYAFKSQHIVTINFYPDYNSNMIEADKPVIYLYSEKPVDAEVTFASKGAVTFTYPKYQDSWKVRVDSQGLRDAETGRSYPYLFWEAEMKELDFKFEESALKGFIIHTDTVVSFLESSLTAMGLNQTEQTDFITFWAPRMITQKYALVQFLTNADYEEKISSLTISPAPDKLLRVYMLFSPLASDRLPIPVQPQQFDTFERSGFTAVEWGGSELPSLQIIP